MQFRVRPARLWDRAFLTSLLVAVGAIWLIWPLFRDHLSASPLPAATTRLTVSLLVGFVVAWLFTRPLRRLGDAVELTPDGLTLPRALTGGAPVVTRLADLRRLELQGVNNRLRLLLGTARGRQVIAAERFESPDDFLDFVRALLQVGGGPTTTERMQLLISVERALSAPSPARPWVTGTLIALCLGMGVAGQLSGSGDFASLVFGGNQPVLVREGEYFRLVTANYLHGGALHLVMNMLSLWNVGQALERMLGRWALLAIYLASGITGALASDWFESARWSVGASTSLFGLVGALAVTHAMHRHDTPAHLLPTGDFWRNTLFFNGMLVLMAPNIDHLGHLGGALGGAGMALALGVRPFDGARARRATVRLVAVLFCVVHFAGLTTALLRPREQRAADFQRWAELELAERAKSTNRP